MIQNEIKERFFRKFDELVSIGKIKSITSFCEQHSLDRRNFTRARKPNFKVPVEYLFILVKHYGTNGNWLLIGD